MNQGNFPHNSNMNNNNGNSNNRIQMHGYGVDNGTGLGMGMGQQQPRPQGHLVLPIQSGMPMNPNAYGNPAAMQQGIMQQGIMQQGGVMQQGVMQQGGVMQPGVMQQAVMGGHAPAGVQGAMPSGGTLTASTATPGGHVSSSTEAQSARSSDAPMMKEIPPLPTSHVKLPNPVRLNEKQSIDTLFFPFFKFCPDMWAKFVTDYDKHKPEILRAYIQWANMIRQQSKASKPTSSGPSKEQIAATKLKSAVMTKKSSLEDKVKKRISDARHTLREQFPTITVPSNDDEKRFLPSKRAQHLLQRSCGSGFEMSKEADLAFELLAQHFVEDSVSFAVAMARRRPKHSSEIRAKDIGLFYKSAFNLIVPVGGAVDKYRYVTPKSTHRIKAAAARKENFAQGKAMYPRAAKEQKTTDQQDN